MTTEITKYVESCSICQSQQRSQPKEPIIIKKIPKLPWEIIAVDIFYFKTNEYLLVADSYSGYFDFVKLKQSSSAEVILQLKKMFAIHGIPFILESDNCPQFSSKEFKAFAKNWDFTLQTSSPRYPKSNGLAERFVQVAKSLLKKCHKDQSDVYLALLNYRNTSRSNDLLSPNQRLMSRRTRTNIPSSEHSLKPKVVQNLQQNLIEARNRSKFHADKGSHQKQPL
ncbi:uncharacterized protein K02A2.6-like [Eupeodes corollae]|uniref:uncharacterized protein K02A2.6-like n=1 Tax=Eupeodes corollae TaxID=290404 RepID=UPI00248F8078|nr:uncharacterized protein K02A2.6-like [Eupeodes corollae]